MAKIFSDRVKELTSITGTGSYSLDGALPSFQTFTDAIGDGNTVDYCITDGTFWEVGTGTITVGTPTTLSRDTIHDSSNAGGAVDWELGNKEIFSVLSANDISGIFSSIIDYDSHKINYANPHNVQASQVPITDAGSNFTATNVEDAFAETVNMFAEKVQNNTNAISDPTVNDDSNAGYSELSIWFNTATSEIFRCMDATVGAAVWVKTSLSLSELGSMASEDAADYALLAGATFTGDVGFDEVATTTSGNISVTGGQVFVQAGAAGSGQTASSGDIVISGYGGADIGNFYVVSDSGTQYQVYHEGNITTSSVISYFTEGRDVTVGINDTVPVHSWEATGSETDIDIALVPKGTGAITAQVADGTVTGGDKRGIYAVDLQLSRFTSANVASGLRSVIIGGYSNTASGNYSSVGGGANNSTSGAYTVVGGGDGNTTAGAYATISGGVLNSLSGDGSCCPGGGYATDRGIHYRQVFASGAFSVTGDAQIAKGVHRVQTTDATSAVLTYNGGAANTTSVFSLPDDYMYAVSAYVSARDTSTGDAKVWKIDGAAKRGSGAATVALVGTPTKTVIAEDTGASTWDCNLVVNTTRGSVEVEVTGEAAKTIHWVCEFDTVEVG